MKHDDLIRELLRSGCELVRHGAKHILKALKSGQDT